MGAPAPNRGVESPRDSKTATIVVLAVGYPKRDLLACYAGVSSVMLHLVERAMVMKRGIPHAAQHKATRQKRETSETN